MNKLKNPQRMLYKALSILILGAFLVQQIGFALPSGINVVSGEVTIDTSQENNLVITASDKAIIEFDSFSIAANEVVRFVQPIDSASVLGRVTGGSSSEIFGSLFANGQFILVNSNGINFHEGANIQVSSLIASTLDIQNALYLENQLTFEKEAGSNPGAILNEANISAQTIALLSESIVNRGTLNAYLGSVVLGVGEKQVLSFSENGLVNLVVERGLEHKVSDDSSIQNEGTIKADGGKIVITAKTLNDTMDTLINNDGLIQASRAVEKDGVIYFVSNGANVNTATGILRSSILDERGYTFRTIGAIDGGLDAYGRVIAGKAFYENLDGAANISGSIGSDQSDTGDLIATGNITLTADGIDFIADSDLDGTGVFTMNSGVSITGGGNSLTIAGATGTLRAISGITTLGLYGSQNGVTATFTANNDITTTGVLTVGYDTDGAASAIDLVMGSNTLTTGGLSVGYGSMNSGGTDSGTWDINGNVTVEDGAANARLLKATSGSMFVSGNFTVGASEATFTHNSGTINFDGSGTQNLDSDAQVFNNITHSGSGTLQLATNNLTGVTGSFTNSAGTFYLNGKNFGFDASRAFSNADGATIRLKAAETLTNVASFDTDSGTVEYVGNGDGSSVQLKDFSALSTDYYNLTINGSSASDTFTVGASTQKDIAGAFTVTSGTYNGAGNTTVTGLTTVNGGTYSSGVGTQTFNGGLTLSSGAFSSTVATDVNGALTISGGTFTAPALGTSFTVSGNFDHSGGTFTANGGTLTLDGTSQQISGSSTFYNLTKTVSSADTLTFEAGTTQTITNTMTLQGDSSSVLLSLRSTVDGSLWKVDPQGSRTASFLDVKDGQNINATRILPTNSVDSGNNYGWFATDPSSGGSTSSTEPEDEIKRLPPPDDESKNPPPGDDGDKSDSGDNKDGEKGDNGNKGDGDKDYGRYARDKDYFDDDEEAPEDVESTTYVEEGAVYVVSRQGKGNMVYPGETISVRAAGARILRRGLYVATGDGLVALRGKTHEKMKEFKWGERPSGLAASKKGDHVYALFSKSRKVLDIDTVSFSATEIVSGLGDGAQGMALHGDRAYVANSVEDRVEVFDVKSGKRIRSYAAGAMPSQLTLTGDGQYLFVANRLSRSVSKIELASGKTVAEFSAGKSPYGLALSKDEKRLFVADSQSEYVFLFDTQDGKLQEAVYIGPSPYALALSPDGGTLFVANRIDNSISLVDTQTLKVNQTLRAGRRPSGMTVLPEGDKLYVANELSGDVSVIDIIEGRKMEDIGVGIGANQIVLSTPERPKIK
ncbi:MAG: filamentous hemagglutinin N-terminal domain-containing protein [Candidatus Omnitrophica bacterium]|nr:filamentous hemagglutinin N-terminal domain-containing protein [Candidatus Omnitrophota bacterium]